jgi:hypothetical protein
MLTISNFKLFRQNYEILELPEHTVVICTYPKTFGQYLVAGARQLRSFEECNTELAT